MTPMDNMDSGLFADLPNPGAATKDKFFFATDTEQLFVSDGDAWIEIGGGGGGALAFAAVVQVASPQSIPDATATAVAFDTVTSDALGFFSIGTPSRLTVPAGEGGTYEATAAVGISAPAPGNDYVIRLLVQGVLRYEKRIPGTVAGDVALDIPAVPLNLSAGNYVEVTVEHNEGANLDTIASPVQTFLSLRKVAA